MAAFAFTAYFERKILIRRPYLTREMCVEVVRNPAYFVRQEKGRFRFWAAVPALGGRFLRVVTLEDMVTIHNAFLDRRFRL